MVIQNLEKLNLSSMEFPPEDFLREATEYSQCPIFTSSSGMQSSGSNENENEGQDQDPTATGAAGSHSDKMSIIAW